MPVGTYERKPRSREKQRAAFHAKVDKSAGPDACWPWTGARQRRGYGHCRINKKDKLAHRIAWEIANDAAIPAGHQVNHACDSPPCCNPAHLHIGTNRSNAAEMVERRRHAAVTHPERIASGDRNGARTRPDRLVRGERHWCSKLSSDQRDEVVALVADGWTWASVAKKFEVCRATVARVLRLHRARS